MVPSEKGDLREILIDAHAHFFFLKGRTATRIRLWQILSDSIIVDAPKDAPMHKTILGYLPTLDGNGVYEIEGSINMEEPLPDQMQGTIHIHVNPASVKRVSRRLYPRVSFTPPLDAAAVEETKKQTINIKIINFSASGIRIEAVSPLSPTATYIFKFKIETEEEVNELSLPGSVVYELPSDSGYTYGIRFGRKKVAECAGPREAPVEELEQTVDLLELVNQLLITRV